MSENYAPVYVLNPKTMVYADTGWVDDIDWEDGDEIIEPQCDIENPDICESCT